MNSLGRLFLILINFSALGFLFSSCAPKVTTDEYRAQLHLQLGTSLLSKGNHPAALQELLTAEKLAPNDPIIQNNLALAYFVRQKFKEAESHLKSALSIHPKYTDAQINLARVYIEMGQQEQAIVWLNKANEDLTYSFPDKVLTHLGMAYFFKGDYQVARDYLKKSLSINRENCLTFNFYGRSLFELGHFPLAVESFDQAINLCKATHFEDPYYFAALSYYKLGDRERAQSRLEELIKSYPESKYSTKSKELLKMIN